VILMGYGLDRRMLLKPLIHLLLVFFNLTHREAGPLHELRYSNRRFEVKVVIRVSASRVEIAIYSSSYDYEDQIASFIVKFLGEASFIVKACPNIVEVIA